jgi:hypothetical protein
MRLAEGAQRTQRLLDIVEAARAEEDVQDAEVVVESAQAEQPVSEIFTPLEPTDDGETVASDFDEEELKDL